MDAFVGCNSAPPVFRHVDEPGAVGGVGGTDEAMGVAVGVAGGVGGERWGQRRVGVVVGVAEDNSSLVVGFIVNSSSIVVGVAVESSSIVVGATLGTTREAHVDRSTVVSVPSLPFEVAPSNLAGTPYPTVVIFSHAVAKAPKKAALEAIHDCTSSKVGTSSELEPGFVQPRPTPSPPPHLRAYREQGIKKSG
jgi:hypothetical protein